MIKPGEIQQKAREAGVRDQQIEKDYILSWILEGIARHKPLSCILVFKGGTVLKKIYFKAYRFSEDLDFTLLDNETSNEQLLTWFTETFGYVFEEANIRLEMISPDKPRDEREGKGIHFYTSYIGPLGGQGNTKKIKIDISRSEKLEFKPIVKNVFSEYSDLKGNPLLCYPLEEVLVEKMRALIQRMQARDFYDIWYLLEVHGMDVDFYMVEFANKCKSKGLSPADFQKKLAERLPQYKGRWQKSMSEQIQELPDFDKVERELQRHFRKLKT